MAWSAVSSIIDYLLDDDDDKIANRTSDCVVRVDHESSVDSDDHVYPTRQRSTVVINEPNSASNLGKQNGERKKESGKTSTSSRRSGKEKDMKRARNSNNLEKLSVRSSSASPPSIRKLRLNPCSDTSFSSSASATTSYSDLSKAGSLSISYEQLLEQSFPFTRERLIELLKSVREREHIEAAKYENAYKESERIAGKVERYISRSQEDCSGARLLSDSEATTSFTTDEDDCDTDTCKGDDNEFARSGTESEYLDSETSEDEKTECERYATRDSATASQFIETEQPENIQENEEEISTLQNSSVKWIGKEQVLRHPSLQNETREVLIENESKHKLPSTHEQGKSVVQDHSAFKQLNREKEDFKVIDIYIDQATLKTNSGKTKLQVEQRNGEIDKLCQYEDVDLSMNHFEQIYEPRGLDKHELKIEENYYEPKDEDWFDMRAIESEREDHCIKDLESKEISKIVYDNNDEATDTSPAKSTMNNIDGNIEDITHAQNEIECNVEVHPPKEFKIVQEQRQGNLNEDIDNIALKITTNDDEKKYDNDIIAVLEIKEPDEYENMKLKDENKTPDIPIFYKQFGFDKSPLKVKLQKHRQIEIGQFRTDLEIDIDSNESKIANEKNEPKVVKSDKDVFSFELNSLDDQHAEQAVIDNIVAETNYVNLIINKPIVESEYTNRMSVIMNNEPIYQEIYEYKHQIDAQEQVELAEECNFQVNYEDRQVDNYDQWKNEEIVIKQYKGLEDNMSVELDRVEQKHANNMSVELDRVEQQHGNNMSVELDRVEQQHANNSASVMEQLNESYRNYVDSQQQPPSTSENNLLAETQDSLEASGTRETTSVKTAIENDSFSSDTDLKLIEDITKDDEIKAEAFSTATATDEKTLKLMSQVHTTTPTTSSSSDAVPTITPTTTTTSSSSSDAAAVNFEASNAGNENINCRADVDILLTASSHDLSHGQEFRRSKSSDNGIKDTDLDDDKDAATLQKYNNDCLVNNELQEGNNSVTRTEVNGLIYGTTAASGDQDVHFAKRSRERVRESIVIIGDTLPIKNPKTGKKKGGNINEKLAVLLHLRKSKHRKDKLKSDQQEQECGGKKFKSGNFVEKRVALFGAKNQPCATDNIEHLTSDFKEKAPQSMESKQTKGSASGSANIAESNVTDDSDSDSLPYGPSGKHFADVTSTKRKTSKSKKPRSGGGRAVKNGCCHVA